MKILGFRRPAAESGESGERSRARWLAVRIDGASVHGVLVEHAERGSLDQDPGARPAPRATLLSAGSEPVKAAGTLDIRREVSTTAVALRRLAQRLGADASTPLVWLIDSRFYAVAQLEAPADTPRPEWAGALRWSMVEMGHAADESSALAWLDVPLGTSYRTQGQVIAASAPGDIIKAIVDVVARAKLSLQAVDIEECALRNISLLRSRRSAVQAILHLAATHATLLVTWGGQALWHRRIEADTAAVLEAARDGREDGVEAFATDLRRSLDSFDRLHTQVSLARVAVTHADSTEPLAVLLAAKLSVPVVAAELVDVVALGDNVGAEDLSTNALLVGLALRGCALQPGAVVAARARGQDQVECSGDPHVLTLVDPAAVLARRSRAASRPALAAASVAAVLLSGAGLHAWAGHLDRQAAFDEPRERERALRETVALDQSNKATTAALAQQKLDALAGLSSSEQLASELRQTGATRAAVPRDVLMALSEATLAQVWVTSFDLDLQHPAFALRGKTTDASKLSEYVQGARLRAALRGMPIESMRVSEESDTGGHAWELMHGTPGKPLVSPPAIVPATPAAPVAPAALAPAMASVLQAPLPAPGAPARQAMPPEPPVKPAAGAATPAAVAEPAAPAEPSISVRLVSPPPAAQQPEGTKP